MNSRMLLAHPASKAAWSSSLTYIVGTPMNTVARGRWRTTAAGSKRFIQIILLPESSAPWLATNSP